MVDNINLITPVIQTGYGVVGYNVALELHHQNVEVALFPTGGLRKDNYLPVFKKMCSNADKFNHYAPCLRIWHQFDLAKSIGRGTYVAWPIFELDKFTKREKHHMSYPDKLIVCSNWAKRIIQDNDIMQEIHVVPLGVNTNIFNHNIKAERKNAQNTVFFHAGKWEVRKGHDILVEMFNNAFQPEDNVELWLMPHNPFLNQTEKENWENMYLSSPLGQAGKIVIIPWQSTQEQVAYIMAQTDCGIFPARAEGWNLELLEMLSMGKPVITTNYSAHTEFCNEENAMLIECNDLELAYDGKWFFEQGYWASFNHSQKEQCIEYMRLVHKVKQDGDKDKLLVNNAGINTGAEFTWQNTVKQLQKVIYD